MAEQKFVVIVSPCADGETDAYICVSTGKNRMVARVTHMNVVHTPCPDSPVAQASTLVDSSYMCRFSRETLTECYARALRPTNGWKPVSEQAREQLQPYIGSMPKLTQMRTLALTQGVDVTILSDQHAHMHCIVIPVVGTHEDANGGELFPISMKEQILSVISARHRNNGISIMQQQTSSS